MQYQQGETGSGQGGGGREDYGKGRDPCKLPVAFANISQYLIAIMVVAPVRREQAGGRLLARSSHLGCARGHTRRVRRSRAAWAGAKAMLCRDVGDCSPSSQRQLKPPKVRLVSLTAVGEVAVGTGAARLSLHQNA